MCTHLATSNGETAGCKYIDASGRCTAIHGSNVRRRNSVGNAAHCRLPSSHTTHTQCSLKYKVFLKKNYLEPIVNSMRNLKTFRTVKNKRKCGLLTMHRLVGRCK